MKFKKVISVLTSAVLTAAFLGGGMPKIKPVDNFISELVVVSAEEAENTQFEADVLYMVLDEVDDKGNHCQWYRTSDRAFRRDGVSIKLNGKDVTDECILTFRNNVTPEKIYDGQHFDYEIPMDIYYDKGVPVTTSIYVKIGQNGDANLDHNVDVRDAALIARNADRLQNNKKGLISDFGKFLTTGTRSNDIYVNSDHAMLIAHDLAVSALDRASGKKVEQKGDGKYSLSLSKANGLPGETVTIQVVVDADDSFESLDALLEWDNKTLGSAAAVAVNGTLCASYKDDGMVSIVDFGHGEVQDGAIASIDFTIPEDAVPGSRFEVYFSDIKNFTVVNDGTNTSEDVKASANISGAQISVNKPQSTTAPVTTASTTTPTTSTTAAVSDTGVTTSNSTTAPSTSAQTTAISTAVSTTTTKATSVFEVTVLRGDANLDGKVDIRDAAYISRAMASQYKKIKLTAAADFNGDGIVNIRDAAAIAIYRAIISKKEKKI